MRVDKGVNNGFRTADLRHCDICDEDYLLIDDYTESWLKDRE